MTKYKAMRMLFYEVIVIFSCIFITTEQNIGTTLLTQKKVDSECWSQEEMVQLQVRSLFESLSPPVVSPSEVNKKYIRNVFNYLESALKVIKSESGPKEILADTFGAHLKSEILPNVRIAYYAGYITFKEARKLHDFLDNIKNILNTQGLGWGKAAEPDWSNMTVTKILIETSNLFDPCAELVIMKDVKSCIRLPSPKLDDDEQPSAIALPFKTGGLFSLTSPNSANIVLKFYKSAASCILNSSPSQCKKADLANFHHEMWYWMKHNIAQHLADEKLYAAYGGVLRVAATVQNSGLSSLMKKHIFTKPMEKIKHTLKLLKDEQSNWIVYTAVIVIAIITLYLLQFCYNYMFGDANTWECFKKKKSDKTFSNDNVKTIFPYSSRSNFSKRQCSYVPSRSKNLSDAAVPTQRVYDMNANVEKTLAILISDEDTSEDDSDDISDVVESPNERIESSPPKIKTRPSHHKPSYSTKSRSLFSNSSCRSDLNYRERKEDTIRYDSESSRNSMVFGKRKKLGLVPGLSKQTGLKSLSTEMDVNSYLTPLSRRNLD